ncbi:relaxase/mobilization nuclease domain-containing protein [Sideroxydans sp.]
MKRGKNSDARQKLRNASGSSQGRGRGIAIKGFKNGKQFGARVAYATNPKKGGEVVLTNCPRDAITRTMMVAARLRPDIQSPVGHLSLSLPPVVTPRSLEEWQGIVQTLLDEIGLDEAFPYVCARHNDANHDHVHLVFCRVSVDGRVHDQANLGLRLQAAEAVIEDQFNLQLFPRGEVLVDVTKNEIEMGQRTGKLPPRLEIRRSLEEALIDKPTIEQLIDRLALAGISARLNASATTGKVSGFSFVYEGIPFPASKVGKEFGWASLQKRITYEQITATEQAAKQRSAESTASNDTAGTDRPTECNDEVRDEPHVQSAGREVNQSPPSNTRPNGKETRLENRALDNGSDLRQYFDNLPCGVRSSQGLIRVHNAGFKTPAWFVAGNVSPVAIGRSDGGITFPQHKRLTDEQLGELIKSVGDPVELFGDDAYLERAARICDQLGVKYDFANHQRKPAELNIKPDVGDTSWDMGV